MADEKNVQETSSKPGWVKMKVGEIEKLVVELAKQGESPAKIGLILRDKYGIPKTRLFGKRITQILEEKGEEYRGERFIINERVESLKSHIEKNHKDYRAKRALTKKLWVVSRFNKSR